MQILLKYSVIPTLLLYCSLLGSHKINLIDLDNSLHSLVLTIERSSEKKDFLLGPFLESHYSHLIIDKDPINNIYQLKALQQSGGTCQYHSIRNCLYMMSILESPKEEFYAIYTDMIDNTLYTQFQNETGCPSVGTLGPGHKYKIITKIKSRALPCMLTRRPCLPRNSSKNCSKLIEFLYQIMGNTDEGKNQKKLAKIAKNYLSALEGIHDLHFAQDVASLFSAIDIDIVVNTLETLNKSDTYMFAIDLAVYTSMGHATCLVVNKYNKAIEYFFLDSLNRHFGSAWGGNYKVAIDKIIHFTKDISYFRDTLVRYIYGHMLYWMALDPTDQFEYLANAYEKLKEYKLLNNKVYQDHYKQAYCNLITKLKKENPEEAKEYDNVYNQFKCT